MGIKYAGKRAITAIDQHAHNSFSKILVCLSSSTHFLLLCPLALYAGSCTLTLDSKLEHLFEFSAVLSFLVQVPLRLSRFAGTSVEQHIEKRCQNNGDAATVLTLAGFVIRIAIWAVAGLVLLKYLKFDITTLVAGLGTRKTLCFPARDYLPNAYRKTRASITNPA